MQGLDQGLHIAPHGKRVPAANPLWCRGDGSCRVFKPSHHLTYQANLIQIALSSTLSKIRFVGNVLLFPTKGTIPANDNAPVQRQERLGGLLSYYHKAA